jgi:hypothetical protein
MLTKSQQKLIISMLMKDISRKENTVYKSKAFYKACTYLERNNVIKKVPQEDKSYELELTLKGRLLAKILAGFNDTKEDIRQRYGLT